jgi:hypothetical protein
MYLDNRKVNDVSAPLVTIGLGCALGPASEPTAQDEVLALPWQIDGVQATPEQIQADYAKVCAASFNYQAPYYAQYSIVRLTDAAIDALCESRTEAFYAFLCKEIPGFPQWPDTAQAGTLDLIYGVGEGGFAAYHHFMQAALNGDFKGMAAECASNATIPAYSARNAARKQLFLDAAC